MQHLHPRSVWLFFLDTALSWGAIVVLCGGFYMWSLADIVEDGGSIGGLLFLIALVFLVAAYVWARLTYHFYRYELREDGFRKEHGIIWKKYVTIPYERIQNVDIYRGLLARILGLSDLQVQTAGGITMSSYGAFSEGRLPGLSPDVAEQIRDELVRRSRRSHQQGL